MENKFQITSKWKWIYGIFAGFYLVGFLVLFLGIFDSEYTAMQRFCAFPFISLGCFFLGLQLVYGYFQTLSMTQEKICFRSFGFNVEINWRSIKRFGIYKYLIWKYEGIYLSKSDGKVTVWFPGVRFDNSEVFIPLSVFADNWRDSDLGRQIKQYAPHLFQ